MFPSSVNGLGHSTITFDDFINCLKRKQEIKKIAATKRKSVKRNNRVINVKVQTSLIKLTLDKAMYKKCLLSKPKNKIKSTAAIPSNSLRNDRGKATEPNVVAKIAEKLSQTSIRSMDETKLYDETLKELKRQLPVLSDFITKAKAKSQTLSESQVKLVRKVEKLYQQANSNKLNLESLIKVEKTATKLKEIVDRPTKETEQTGRNNDTRILQQILKKIR